MKKILTAVLIAGMLALTVLFTTGVASAQPSSHMTTAQQWATDDPVPYPRPGHNGYTDGPGGTPPPPGISGPYPEPGFVPPGPYQIGGPVPPNVWGPPQEVIPQIPGMIPLPTIPGLGLIPRSPYGCPQYTTCPGQ